MVDRNITEDGTSTYVSVVRVEQCEGGICYKADTYPLSTLLNGSLLQTVAPSAVKAYYGSKKDATDAGERFVIRNIGYHKENIWPLIGVQGLLNPEPWNVTE